MTRKEEITKTRSRKVPYRVWYQLGTVPIKIHLDFSKAQFNKTFCILTKYVTTRHPPPPLHLDYRHKNHMRFTPAKRCFNRSNFPLVGKPLSCNNLLIVAASMASIWAFENSDGAAASFFFAKTFSDVSFSFLNFDVE